LNCFPFADDDPRKATGVLFAPTLQAPGTKGVPWFWQKAAQKVKKPHWAGQK